MSGLMETEKNVGQTMLILKKNNVIMSFLFQETQHLNQTIEYHIPTR